MLRSGWVLERYLGWKVVSADQDRLKLVSRTRGPFSSYVLIVQGAADAQIREVLERHRLFGVLAGVLIRDLDGRSTGEWERLTGRRLEEVSSGFRFGVGTFVVDLFQSEAELWARLAQRPRRMCRKAEQAGLRVVLEDGRVDGTLDSFYQLYEPLALERALQIPDRGAIRRMAQEGELLVVECRSVRGELLASNLVFRRSDTGFYLYGARRGRSSDGAAHLAHWETMRRLKTENARWYDLGQVPSLDPQDGLHAFKSEFGGVYLHYGREFRWSSLGWRLAERLRSAGSHRRATALRA